MTRFRWVLRSTTIVGGCASTPGSDAGWVTLIDGAKGLENWDRFYMRCADAKVLTDKSCYEADIFDQRPDPSGSITTG